jgi:NitT/TauT family transport system substrate-binding protein
LWMARDAGLFKAQGLAVEIVNMEGGSRGLRAISAGQIQANNVGLSAVVEANAKGGDFRLIASSSNTMRFGFFGGRGVTSAADLKGQKIGISSFASESDVAATLALKQLGLTRQDVTVVESGATLRRLAALESGAIKATPLNEPANAMAQKKGLPRLVDLAETTPWIFNGVVVSRSLIAGNRDVLKRFMRAYLEGTYLALADAARAKEVLAKEFKTSDAGVIEATYADFRKAMPRDAVPSRPGAENNIAQFQSTNAAPVDKSVDAYVDASIIADLRAEGFMAALAAKYGR